MIYHFIQFLRGTLNWDVPYALDYYSTRLCLAALTALLCTILLGPAFIKKLYELKIGQHIRQEECPLLAELHRKKQDTPTMGGLLMIVAILLALFLWMDLTSPFTIILLITTIYMSAIGIRDDYLKLKKRNAKGLSGKKKFALQCVFALLLGSYLLSPFAHGSDLHRERGTEAVADVKPSSLQSNMSELYIPFYKEPILRFSGWGLLFLLLFFVVVICGSSNAVNLTDGLDGLAAGNLIMVSASLSVVAFVSNHVDVARYLNILYVEGSGEIAIFLSAVAGACLGFLWYNSHPAQVFMGDTGSLTLGGVIGVSAILIRREFFLALVGGVFVAEALSVILQVLSYKFRNKKRIFLCSPLHHHFEYKGWPETKVVLRFWIFGFILTLIGVASLKLQ